MLLDNKTHGKVGDVLEGRMSPGCTISMLSQQFSLFAFASMYARLEKAASLRLLLSPALRAGQVDASQLADALGLLGESADRRDRNSLTAPLWAKRCAQWLNRVAQVRAVSLPVPQGLFLVDSSDGQRMAIQGSSQFTSAGLGYAPSQRFEMNSWFTTDAETAALLEWFNSIWENPSTSADAKARILAALSDISTAKAPEELYFASLFQLFRDTLGELDEERIIKTQTGIRDTLVWSKLYRFQRDGVLGAISKIERYNGCIIADSVGLGKTFEALAIIKYYELRNDRVLVLAPKRLRENWTLYTVNDRRNLFAADRFNFDVLNHTDLSRSGGHSGEINLDTINWGNYDLVVIDESHNFRNNPPRKDGLTRYSRLMRDIIRQGVKTKVLMLSATPVNSRMNDLKNQVAFITEGRDDALYSEGISSIEATLRKAQTKFNQWLRLEGDERSTKSLLDALNFDYFKLLDLLTIARSRKHITKYYSNAEIGEFPIRSKPINIKADIDTRDQFPELREINRNIRRLHLSAYAPLKYILPEKLEVYSKRYDREVKGGSVFKQIDREQSLIHLMRVNLLKRMESSINSFGITLEKLLNGVRLFLAKLENHESREIEEMSIEETDIESEELDPFLLGTKIKVLIQDVDRIRWKQELREDEELLVAMLREARQIDEGRDAKLMELKKLIHGKVRNPINPGNRKIILFTAFADTAEYLYANLAEWAHTKLGMHAAIVTGRSNSNKTTLAGIRKDLASVITAFSPLSKERAKIDETATDEIDLLIATDCISEGQNLQDCDYLINYDIHWNPVRIIQRFGRIDRLGSKNTVIQLVNFWPNMELDEYINLEARVAGRMATFGGPLARQSSEWPSSAETDDRGLFPDESIREEYPVPAPSRLDDPADVRRVRALVVDLLEKAALEGHTLLPRSWVIKKARELAIQPPCPLGENVLNASEESFAPFIARAVTRAGEPAYQVDRLVDCRAIIRREILGRRDGKLHVAAYDWRKLVDDGLGNPLPEDLGERELEERARQEKAAALEQVFCSRLSVLIGSAGTGKTTLLRMLCSLPGLAARGLLLLAPTGKARVRLEERTGLRGLGRTLAQFLNRLQRYDCDTGSYFTRPKAPRCGDYRTVIVDECSMLTEEQLAALIDSLTNVERLVLVGDPRQLPPIGAGRPFVDIVRELEPKNVETLFPRNGPGYAELTIPRRQQGEARPDVLLASLFSGRPLDPGVDCVLDNLAGGDDCRLRFVQWNHPPDLQEKIIDELADALKLAGPNDELTFEESIGGSRHGDIPWAFFWNKFGENPGAASKAESWQILSPVRAGLTGVDALNRMIQSRFRRKVRELAEAVGWGRKVPRPVGPQTLLYGDKIINVVNQRRRDVWPSPDGETYVANGDIGIVVGQYKTQKFKGLPWKLEVEFVGQLGHKYGFYPGEFGDEGANPLELAYCLTVHKTQGSEFGLTFVVLNNPCWLLSRELLYTALTRHQNRLVILHQGPIVDYRRYSGEEHSEIARRVTNLFVDPLPREVIVGTKQRFLEEGLIHRTERGDLVRSKSELVIADKLNARGIDYAYEQPLVLPNGHTRYPDFTISNHARGVTFYWEHLGLLDDPAYRARWEKKRAEYLAAGIPPHEEGGGTEGVLIETRDDPGGSLDAYRIAELIEKVVLG